MLTEDNPSTLAAGRFFKTLHQELAAREFIELRCKALGAGGKMRQAFVATVEKAARIAASMAKSHDVYAGVATRCGEDGTKRGVRRIPALWADLDAKDGHTKESRLAQVMALPYHPSIKVWTGGGWHIYWLLVKSAVSPEEMDRAELAMRRISTALDSDSVHDRSRILRVPGTFNHKYGKPILVELVRCDPECRYELSALEEMAQALPDAVDGRGGSDDGTPREVLSEPIREGGRNLTLMSVAGSLRSRGLDVAIIKVLLVELNQVRCEPPLGDDEVINIAQSVGRYPAGSLRYRRSSARRVRDDGKKR